MHAYPNHSDFPALHFSGGFFRAPIITHIFFCELPSLAYTIWGTDAGLKLAQRLRRWPNFKPISAPHIVRRWMFSPKHFANFGWNPGPWHVDMLVISALGRRDPCFCWRGGGMIHVSAVGGGGVVGIPRVALPCQMVYLYGGAGARPEYITLLMQPCWWLLLVPQTRMVCDNYKTKTERLVECCHAGNQRSSAGIVWLLISQLCP